MGRMEKVFAHSTIAMDTMRRGQQPTYYRNYLLFFLLVFSCLLSLAEAPQACRQGPSGSDLVFRAYHALVVFWTYRMGLLSDVEDE